MNQVETIIKITRYLLKEHFDIFKIIVFWNVKPENIENYETQSRWRCRDVNSLVAKSFVLIHDLSLETGTYKNIDLSLISGLH